TDIPRLQVCCYLSRIRTELHYRQVLGRVLRRTGESDHQAWLFMLAEPTLQGFAERISDDLPDDLAVLKYVQMPGLTPGSKLDPIGEFGHVEGVDGAGVGCGEQGTGSQATNIISLGGYATESAYQVSFSQHYRQQLLACF
ncbi:TPA: diguanylate cyclase, partial [Pseudomonas aeruginosa]|nr:diguanylate cyclase [Pseudomonas aeruginosa]